MRRNAADLALQADVTFLNTFQLFVQSFEMVNVQVLGSPRGAERLSRGGFELVRGQ